MNLVPFGEFVPPLFGFVNRITQRGRRLRARAAAWWCFPSGGHSLGAFICYESVVPALRAPLRRAAGAEVLVNISNDGYFGRSAAREQHLKIVRMRAAENRRWILRATNDGITATIDPAGRVTQRLEPYREASVHARFAWSRETSFYTWHGDWFAWLCLGVGITAAAGRATRFPKNG